MDVIDSSLIGSRVRVLFEDPGESDSDSKRGKVWKGVLSAIGSDFIELTNDGTKSYVNRKAIIAISETLER